MNKRKFSFAHIVSILETTRDTQLLIKGKGRVFIDFVDSDDSLCRDLTKKQLVEALAARASIKNRLEPVTIWMTNAAAGAMIGES